MNIFIEIFGQGVDLNVLQMSCRGIVIFFIALVLIRISGRRSFGMRSPLDNIIVITLGAVLSRAIVGVSPFLTVIITCFVIVLLHRVLGLLIVRNKRFSNLVEGNKILLFKDGQFIRKNINRALVGDEDIMQGIRETALTDNLDKIDKVYMERNGQISATRKELS